MSNTDKVTNYTVPMKTVTEEHDEMARKAWENGQVPNYEKMALSPLPDKPFPGGEPIPGTAVTETEVPVTGKYCVEASASHSRESYKK